MWQLLRQTACFLLVLLCASAARAQTDLERGWQSFYRGEYAAAAQAFERATENPAALLSGLIGQSRALQEMGEYERSRAVVLEAYNTTPAGELANRLGEIAAFLGEETTALRHFEAAVQINPTDLPAQFNLAALRWHRGERSTARQTFLAFVDFYLTAKQSTAEEILMVARACTYLERFQDANRLFREAIQREPINWTLYIPWGELFLEKYNLADARGVFQDALKSNPRAVLALLGLARCAATENLNEALAFVQRAAALNPRSPQVCTTWAELYLAANDEKSASEQLDQIEERFPSYSPALALRAIIADRRNDAAAVERLCQHALQINPKATDIYLSLGEDAARRYLFRESAAFFRQALALDPERWAAAAGLGTSLSRLGQEREAKQWLERAFEHDPFNVHVGNVLNLFDDFAKYDTIRTPHFLLRMHRDDVPIIGSTAASLCEAAYNAMVPRYKTTLPSPIVVEIFPKHDDFAVRCFGLPGAQVFLGICFGRLIAMNSPRARDQGAFNWQETLWHEIAHVIHLELTANRIPRWLAEGIAVYEAAAARSEWSMNMELAMVRALRSGQLLPLRDLDTGFTRNPELVSLSYYQASQIIEFITERYGFDKVLLLFPHFKQGKKTEEAITAVFGQSVDEFDNAFQDFLRDRFQPNRTKTLWPSFKQISDHGANQPQDLAELRRRAESDPQDFFANLLYGARLAKNGQNAEAEIYLKKAQALFPEYVDANNPYELLAEIYWQQNRRAEAVAELEYLTAKNGKAYQAAARLAEWQLAVRDTVAATRATERALAIFPYNLALQRQHGQLLLALHQPQAAVQAFRTVLELNPVDQADAYCWLAHAYLTGGQKQLAKKHALLALEIAPTFERAQEILLQAVE